MITLLADGAGAAINWHTVLFYVVALAACGFAAVVAVSNNIVRMAFGLIVCLSAVSGLLFLAGAHFVAAMQLMVYVGGTVVLLVFGVMLTAQKAFVTMKTSAGDWVLGIVVGGTLLALLGQLIFAVPRWQSSDYQTRVDAERTAYLEELQTHLRQGQPVTEAQRQRLAELETRFSQGHPEQTAQLGLALVGVRADRPSAEAQGYSGYLLPFEIVSMHLLVVLVGAAYLARARRRRAPQTEAKGVVLP